MTFKIAYALKPKLGNDKGRFLKLTGKYPKILKKTKARINHQCSYCEETILGGDYYYREALKDAFSAVFER